jgi:hypothetical protein
MSPNKRTISLYQYARQLLAVSLAALLIPAAQMNLYAQDPPPQGAYSPLEAVQLDQLVAPIALYPDALVAQILTASTYPDQIAEAANWYEANKGLPRAERANIVNGMNWDPSVKAVTAFPAILNNLARNNSWASQLGNAYYNQPADVMNAVQAMRFQAQQSGTLVSTPQQRVYAENGEIMIAPVNPALVYVPYYNPWGIWGPMFVAYPGYYMFPPPPGLVLGLGIGFGVGIGIGLFAHYGWGWGAWGANWHGGGVFYNHAAYYSRSVTVYNHGHFGGYNRGVFEHAGRGVPGGFHAAATRASFGHAEGARAAAPHAAAPRAAAPRAAEHSAPAGRPASAAHSAPGGHPASAAHAAPAAHAASPSHAPAAHAAAAKPANAGHASAGKAAPAAHAAHGESGGHKK